jgi:hypothetical protein
MISNASVVTKRPSRCGVVANKSGVNNVAD